MSHAIEKLGNVLILGAGSGIGRAIAHRWAQASGAVLLAGRDSADSEKSAADLRLRYSSRAQAIRFDALDFDSHRQFFAKCAACFEDGLDGVFLCYGDLTPQETAARDFGSARRMIDTNFTSAVSLLNLAADYFEARKSGFICALSSVAGDRGRQSNYLYGSTKAALTAYLQGLRQRLFKSGVAVTTVKPGFVDTAMTWGLPGMFLVASPDHVADDVLRAVRKGKGEIYTPWFWRFIMRIIKSIPDRIFRKLKL